MRTTGKRLAHNPARGNSMRAGPIATYGNTQMQTTDKTTVSNVPANVPAKRGKAGKASKPTSGADKKALAPFIRKNRQLARDAAGIVRDATNFGQLSDRDVCYIRFYGSVMRKHGHKATLRQIDDAGLQRNGKSYNPEYSGSSKSTDVGAIDRLFKAGLLTHSDNGSTLHATPLMQSHAAYNGK